MPALNKIITVNLMLLVLLYTGQSRVTVLQHPQSVDATEGDSVTMYCTYGDRMVQVPVGQVSWSRGASRENATDLEGDPQLVGRLEKSKPRDFIERKIFIKISDVRRHDSATYYCTVKAMGGASNIGNGTKLRVKRLICGNEFLSPPATGLLVGKCVLIALLILFGVVVCLVKPKNPDCDKG
ncbi:natural cytotoxicity triggering receptor 3-like [Cetorhinus maximus]